jgi:hypothetical protein
MCLWSGCGAVKYYGCHAGLRQLSALDRGFGTVPGKPQQAQTHRALGGSVRTGCAATTSSTGHRFIVKAPLGISLSKGTGCPNNCGFFWVGDVTTSSSLLKRDHENHALALHPLPFVLAQKLSVRDRPVADGVLFLG